MIMKDFRRISGKSFMIMTQARAGVRLAPGHRVSPGQGHCREPGLPRARQGRSRSVGNSLGSRPAVTARSALVAVIRR
jgi:hypothetical protein